jgi:hypothetical protein
LPISGTFELRKLVALLIAFLLPLQTLTALAMPMQGAATDMVVQAEHCPGHDGAADAQPQNAGGLACEQCGICHLACSGMMPAAEATAPSVAVPRVFLAEAEPMPASHTPEEPNPPPVAPRS